MTNPTALEMWLNGVLQGVALTVAVSAALWIWRPRAALRYAVRLVLLVIVGALPITLVVGGVGAGAEAAGGAAGSGVASAAVAGWGVLPASLTPALRLGVLVWSAAAVTALVRLALSLRRVLVLKRGAGPLPPGLSERISRLGPRLTRRRVDVRVSASVESPVALGFVRPMVLLPERLLNELSDGEVEHVVAHELAHVGRYDDWTNLLQHLLQALMILHPAVPWIGRRLALEREIACDELAARQAGSRREYAACLTRIAALGVRSGAPAVGAALAERASELGRRVEYLMAARDRARPTPAARALAAAVGLAGAAALGAMPHVALAPVAVQAGPAVMAPPAARPGGAMIPDPPMPPMPPEIAPEAAPASEPATAATAATAATVARDAAAAAAAESHAPGIRPKLALASAPAPEPEIVRTGSLPVRPEARPAPRGPVASARSATMDLAISVGTAEARRAPSFSAAGRGAAPARRQTVVGGIGGWLRVRIVPLPHRLSAPVWRP